MRKTILLGSVLLLAAGWAAAQNDSGVSGATTGTITSATSDATTDATASGGGAGAQVAITLEGCLGAAIGNYTLTNLAGATYQLTGNTEQLKRHDGEMLRVTGVVTELVHVPGAMNEGTETQPTLSVTSFRTVSKVCGDADSLP